MEFGGCYELSGISLPDTVTSIGNNAFYDCDTLTSISFSDTSTWYKTTNADNWANKTGAGFSSTSQKNFFLKFLSFFANRRSYLYVDFFPYINNFKEDKAMSLKNRKYKDSVFTDLFGSDKTAKENFLSLYNALSGSDFKLNKVSMERKVIEQSLYKTFNNDVSWEINGKLIVLVEHQSTINENMPFRCLEYVTRIYEEIIPIKTRYAEKVFKIPNPDFYVVYVGKKDYPKEKDLKLSDAFYVQDGSKLELVVKIKNCSDSKFLPLFQNCDILKQYCRFIEIVEENYNERFPKRSFKKAIEQAMSEGILTDYLDRKSREVINMLCAKYDYKMDIAVKQEEAFADGKAEGLVEGIEQGSQQKAIEAARKLKENGISVEIISKCIGLSIDEVESL